LCLEIFKIKEFKSKVQNLKFKYGEFNMTDTKEFLYRQKFVNLLSKSWRDRPIWQPDSDSDNKIYEKWLLTFQREKKCIFCQNVWSKTHKDAWLECLSKPDYFIDQFNIYSQFIWKSCQHNDIKIFGEKQPIAIPEIF